ncbi:YcgL domain-containing protein [Alteromonas aestuariivivens]|uniref:YcgL domain-containing protein DXV75_13210 n=1 Tax=Alteromonas aestuariivivens TaxID=1938339 RepID=A0A3D8M652_9ALTE|nr:YcgL domain-containing protein [Alteromonas aestuariivivens]RDV24642.1 YcgL domain-containing protein [Alteromonas aestuariivivens]
MLCAVYKTRRKEGMYLYVPGKDKFEQVPEPLLKQFGQPQLVMLLPLGKRGELAGVDKTVLEKALSEQGFYLQMPPKQENWLAEHRQSLGASARSEDKK